MANISDGWLVVESPKSDFLEDLKMKIETSPHFNYGGDCDANISKNSLEVGFTGRNTCQNAWNYIIELIEDEEYEFRKDLISAHLGGSGNDYGTGYSEEILKESGQKEILQTDVDSDGFSDDELDEDEDDINEDGDEPEIDYNDKASVLKAVSEWGFHLEQASEALRNDKEVVLAAISNFAETIQYASTNLKSDKEVALAAVNSSGLSLEFVSDNLKSDREVVTAAVSEWGMALEFASKELRSDEELARLAFKTTPDAYDVIDDSLKNVPEFIEKWKKGQF